MLFSSNYDILTKLKSGSILHKSPELLPLKEKDVSRLLLILDTNPNSKITNLLPSINPFTFPLKIKNSFPR